MSRSRTLPSAASSFRLGTAPHPVTVYTRGHIKDYIYIYNYIMNIIQLLLSGGSNQGLGSRESEVPKLLYTIEDAV